MNFINDLPFYIVITAVFLNILLGVFTKADFTVLMIRSIIVTVVFSVLGFILSEMLKKAAENDKKNRKNKEKEYYQSEEISGSTIDIQVPPIDESELFNYNEDETGRKEEDFYEVNPAYLHKISQEEQNE